VRNIEYIFHAGNSTKTTSISPRNVSRNFCYTPPLTLLFSRSSSLAWLQRALPEQHESLHRGGLSFAGGGIIAGRVSKQRYNTRIRSYRGKWGIPGNGAQQPAYRPALTFKSRSRGNFMARLLSVAAPPVSARVRLQASGYR